MPMTRCPGCSQELDVETQWLGQLVCCDACGKEFEARLSRKSIRLSEDNYDNSSDLSTKFMNNIVVITVSIIGGIFVLILFFCCIGSVFRTNPPTQSSSADSRSNWQTVGIGDSNASVLFPRQPEYKWDEDTSEHKYTYISKSPSFLLRFSQRLIKSEAFPNLDNFIKFTILLANKNGTANIREIKTEVDGHNAVDLIYTKEGNLIRERYLILGKSLYSLAVYGLDEDDPTSKRFLNSFKFNDTQ